MKRLIAMVMLVLLWVLPAGAAEPENPPAVTGAGVYLRRPGGIPTEIDFDENSHLTEAVPPGSYLYFVIDNASIAGHIAGYSAYLRLSKGEEALDGPALIRYLELFGEDGSSRGYHYTVQLHFSDAAYDPAPKVEGEVWVDRRAAGRQNAFKFVAVVQQGPLEASLGEIRCEPDIGAFTFAHEYAETRLFFEELAEFRVRTGRQGPLDLSYGRDYHLPIAARYDEGEFSSIGFGAEPVFDNMGELRFYLPPTTYIYELTARGLRGLRYSYDSNDGCFVLDTRRLGLYIFSTVALPEHALSDFKLNPPTGAAV